MVNISRGQLAVKWFETRHERKKEARQEPALMRREPQRKAAFSWGPSTDARLRSLWFTETHSTIPGILGCSHNTMYTRAEVLKLPKTITCPKRAHVRWARHENLMKNI